MAADALTVTCSERVNELRGYTPAERAEAIEQLGALLCATQAALCDVVTAADAEADWQVDGATGMAPWLVGTLHVASGTARDWVRVDKALDGLPHLRQAFGEGTLSWDQVRPATNFVTAQSDARQAKDLPGCSAAQVEDLARQHHIRTRADALLELADQRAAADADPDTCLVVVHAPAEVIDRRVEGNGTIDDLQVPADTVLRLLCDCKLEFHIDGPDGTTVGIGRADRSIPRWLRRRIRRRDSGCCRFPGCGRRIRQIHHIQHWARDQGPTDAWNLCGLCWYHHHLVHEGGWTITGNADTELTFTSPYGRTIHSKPQPLKPHTRHRTQQATGIRLDPDNQAAGARAGPAA